MMTALNINLCAFFRDIHYFSIVVIGKFYFRYDVAIG